MLNLNDATREHLKIQTVAMLSHKSLGSCVIIWLPSFSILSEVRAELQAKPM